MPWTLSLNEAKKTYPGIESLMQNNDGAVQVIPLDDTTKKAQFSNAFLDAKSFLKGELVAMPTDNPRIKHAEVLNEDYHQMIFRAKDCSVVIDTIRYFIAVKTECGIEVYDFSKNPHASGLFEMLEISEAEKNVVIYDNPDAHNIYILPYYRAYGSTTIHFSVQNGRHDTIFEGTDRDNVTIGTGYLSLCFDRDNEMGVLYHEISCGHNEIKHNVYENRLTFTLPYDYNKINKSKLVYFSDYAPGSVSVYTNSKDVCLTTQIAGKSTPYNRLDVNSALTNKNDPVLGLTANPASHIRLNFRKENPSGLFEIDPDKDQWVIEDGEGKAISTLLPKKVESDSDRNVKIAILQMQQNRELKSVPVEQAVIYRYGAIIPMHPNQFAVLKYDFRSVRKQK